MPQLWRKVAIVGVGLIGGSVGLSLLKRKLAGEVVGVGRRSSSLVAARRTGAVTATTTQLAKGVEGADLVVVCTPVENIVEQVRAVAQAFTRKTATAGTKSSKNSDVLVTDAGSTKFEIVRQLDALQRDSAWPGRVQFLGSHPIAGNEKRGAQHGSADLFVGRTVVITPTETSAPAEARKLKQFWTALGARVVSMTPEAHDLAMARISHMPHLVASAIAGATPDRYVSLSGTGWQDTTRIAAGDPTLWRQILLANRENVLQAIDGFNQRLNDFRNALATSDVATLERLLAEAKKIRDAVNGTD